MSQSITPGTKVRVDGYGMGEVQAVLPSTAIVRFGADIQECDLSDLRIISDLTSSLLSGAVDPALDVVIRMQAEAITSINSTWGVFARSRIALLPHQLWVCRKVLETWPAHWLVADDVGLGKTIEAGLILSALMSRKLVRRFLVLCPAALVDQWQYRLRTMFDIRTNPYTTDADTENRDFWNSNEYIVASIHTLRTDHKDRQQRLLNADPFDLLIVDEAHHLNADEQRGLTLTFRLVQKLVERKRVDSMVFFSGTPHRGKRYGFFSMLGLLQPAHFGPKLDYDRQLSKLPNVMIRNNKQNVTDLKGNPLFKAPKLRDERYSYSKAEKAFYDTLTEFIVEGKAYASTLGDRDGRAVILVLISMQKLASSSVSAILRALRGRLARIIDTSESLQKISSNTRIFEEKEDADLNRDLDRSTAIDEQLAETQLKLIAHERDWLEKLIETAEAITSETKIQAIIKTIKAMPAESAVLLFTEYKATQSLLLSTLIAEFGKDSVAFINGDGEALDVRIGGKKQRLRESREVAARRFNDGRCRFLVSTEAAGEGIDLQQNCHRLIHVDLPWNPMRLHQRVGRLNRYGQKHQVEVTSFRNPATVEDRIWEKLTEKIKHINAALKQVMADPEDMYQLVLGMTPPEIFNETYSESVSVGAESFDEWFDRKTSRFGSQDVIDAVKDLIGNCSRFDFQNVSQQLPQVDLPDLENFFMGSLLHNRRQPKSEHGRWAFRAPEAWTRKDLAILPDYSNMHFDRERAQTDGPEYLLGVGHKLMDFALADARDLETSLGYVTHEKLTAPIVACRVFDRVTTGTSQRSALVFGVEVNGSEYEVMPDWVLLQRLNELSPRSLHRAQPPVDPATVIDVKVLELAKEKALTYAEANGAGFRQAAADVICAILPYRA